MFVLTSSLQSLLSCSHPCHHHNSRIIIIILLILILILIIIMLPSSSITMSSIPLRRSSVPLGLIAASQISQELENCRVATAELRKAEIWFSNVSGCGCSTDETGVAFNGNSTMGTREMPGLHDDTENQHCQLSQRELDVDTPREKFESVNHCHPRRILLVDMDFCNEHEHVVHCCYISNCRAPGVAKQRERQVQSIYILYT